MKSKPFVGARHHDEANQNGVSEILRIVAPHFVAGVVLEDDIVTCAAPIVRYMHGWRGFKVIDYCKRKNWEVYAC